MSRSEISLTELESALVRHGVIHKDAIDDAENYDMGMTREAILKVYEDITHMMESWKAKQGKEQ
jgi:hypothetical protein